MSFSYEVNIICDNPNCSAIVTGVPEGIEAAIASAIQEAKSNRWLVELAPDGKTMALCPGCKESK